MKWVLGVGTYIIWLAIGYLFDERTTSYRQKENNPYGIKVVKRQNELIVEDISERERERDQNELHIRRIEYNFYVVYL